MKRNRVVFSLLVIISVIVASVVFFTKTQVDFMNNDNVEKNLYKPDDITTPPYLEGLSLTTDGISFESHSENSSYIYYWKLSATLINNSEYLISYGMPSYEYFNGEYWNTAPRKRNDYPPTLALGSNEIASFSSRSFKFSLDDFLPLDSGLYRVKMSIFFDMPGRPSGIAYYKQELTSEFYWESPPHLEGVSLVDLTVPEQPESVYTWVASAILTNDSEYSISWGDWLYLDYFDGTNWLTCPVREDWSPEAGTAVGIPPFSSQPVFINLMKYFPLDSGLYRIRTTIGFDLTKTPYPESLYKQEVTAEFYWDSPECVMYYNSSSHNPL